MDESVAKSCSTISTGPPGKSPLGNDHAMNGANNEHHVPTTPEEITASWLASVLGHHVKSFTIQSAVQNETTSKIFVALEYEDGAASNDSKRPKRLCLKGSFNPARISMPGYSQLLKAAYTREVDFFCRLQPLLSGTPLRLPKVWGTATSADPFQAVLAMEDLSQRGCVFPDPSTACPVPLVVSAVEQLAALHAATWGFTHEDHPWLTRDYEKTILGMAAMWDDVILGADRPPVPDIIRDRVRTMGALEKYFATPNTRFQCVVHGDPHQGNTYVDEQGRPSFLDWQICHIGSAFHDVAYYVIGALSVEDRKLLEMAILDHYLQTLAKLGGPCLSRDDEEVMQEYRKCNMTGMGWVMTPYALVRKERVVPMVERYCTAMVDHKVIELFESLP